MIKSVNLTGSNIGESYIDIAILEKWTIKKYLEILCTPILFSLTVAGLGGNVGVTFGETLEYVIEVVHIERSLNPYYHLILYERIDIGWFKILEMLSQ